MDENTGPAGRFFFILARKRPPAQVPNVGRDEREHTGGKKRRQTGQKGNPNRKVSKIHEDRPTLNVNFNSNWCGYTIPLPGHIPGIIGDVRRNPPPDPFAIFSPAINTAV